MVYKYLNGSQVYIYPSANSDDGGDVNNESNLKTLLGSLTSSNFVVKHSESVPEPLSLVKGRSTQKIYLVNGSAVVDGHYIKITGTDTDAFGAQGVDLGTVQEFITAVGYSVTSDSAYLVLSLLKDTTGNTRGDLLEGAPGDYVRIAKGIGLTLSDDPWSLADSVVLGELAFEEVTPGTYVYFDFTINPDAGKYLSTSSINFNETGNVLNPIYIDDTGVSQLANQLFTCDTAGNALDKVLEDLPTLLNPGDKVKVQFTNANTAVGTESTPLTLNGIAIYLPDDRLCTWYALYEINTVYEFAYIEVSGDGRWVLLNPGSPVIRGVGPDAYENESHAGAYLPVSWRESNGVVTMFMRDNWTESGGSVWHNSTQYQLPEFRVPTTTYTLSAWSRNATVELEWLSGTSRIKLSSVTGIADISFSYLI